MEILIELVGLVLALVLSAFFNAGELAFTSLDHAHVALWEKQRRLGARLTAAWHRRPEHVVIMVLVGNTLVTNAGAALATLLGLQMGWPEWTTSLAMTIVVLVGCESLPKISGHWLAYRLFPTMALPLRFLQLALWPVTAPFTALFRLLPDRDEREVLHMRAHIQHVAQDMGESGVLGRHESHMIRRALDLRERRVGELMTPRTELAALPLDASPAAAAELILAGGKSSIPLYQGDLDRITGYVTARDLFQQPSALKEIRREPLFVPVSMKARDLLAAFGRGPARLAVALDEYGGTAGLLTLEDLLEDLVGAIQDEHDQDRRDGIPLADGRWFVPARLRLEGLAERTGIHLESESADTLGGWVTERLGRIPVEGERLELPPLVVSVVAAGPRHLRHLIVQAGQPPAGEEREDES